MGIDLGRGRVPDGTALLRFRRELEDKKLGAALTARVGEVLQAKGMKVGTGTIVDATIIARTELDEDRRAHAGPRDAPDAMASRGTSA